MSNNLDTSRVRPLSEAGPYCFPHRTPGQLCSLAKTSFLLH